MRNGATTYFSPDEIRQLSRSSDLAGVGATLWVWLSTAALLALAAWQPHPLVILFTVIALGGRQMAFAVLMHEGAHGTLARTRWLNDLLGHWLAAAVIVQDMHLYRRHHMKHHRHTGTEADPDLSLAAGFPVTSDSLRRKFLRDATGATGIKTFIGTVMMLGGLAVYDVSGNFRRRDLSGHKRTQLMWAFAKGLYPQFVTNLALLVVLAVSGYAWLYLLWIAAWLTAYQVVLRVRSIAEHAMTDEPDNALRNSRTTLSSWWQRLLWAPMNVNYHIEHHMLPKVPFYNLPTMHALLVERGAHDGQSALATDYRQVLRDAGSR